MKTSCSASVTPPVAGQFALVTVQVGPATASVQAEITPKGNGLPDDQVPLRSSACKLRPVNGVVPAASDAKRIRTLSNAAGATFVPAARYRFPCAASRR